MFSANWDPLFDVALGFVLGVAWLYIWGGRHGRP